MKRRTFFSAVAALCVSPTLPAAPATGVMTFSNGPWAGAEMWIGEVTWPTVTYWLHDDDAWPYKLYLGQAA